jgi:hypothetical protein
VPLGIGEKLGDDVALGVVFARNNTGYVAGGSLPKEAGYGPCAKGASRL